MRPSRARNKYMAEIKYDDGSLMLDAQRIWLVSGSVHYFRIPSGLWRDRLTKAKRAGLNCISTFIPWNYHEPAEGLWELSDHKDVSAFVRLAGELGLYVIIKPGPYIGGDVDFGGLPGWLTSKSGIAYRNSNAAYTHYFDKYLSRILAPLAEHQVTRGGNIILVQNENDCSMDSPERVKYLQFVNQLIRRTGFDIPIITSNSSPEKPLDGTIQCLIAKRALVANLKQLRLYQQNAPLIVSQLPTGAADSWAQEHNSMPAHQNIRHALEALGWGAQYNFYPFCGGTNMEFLAGRGQENPQSYRTTSYDCDAPVAEGGGLTRKYYLSRLVNMLANHMGPFFAEAYNEEPGVNIHDSTDVLNIYSPTGQWAVITNNDRQEITTARISLPNAHRLTVPLEPLGATAVPVNLQLSEEHKLNYTNLMPFGFFGGKTLVFHGPAGWEGQFCLDDQQYLHRVPDSDEPDIIEHQDLRIVIINSELAQRCWYVDEMLIFGPSYVGADSEDVTPHSSDKQYTILASDGEPVRKKYKPQSAGKRTTPRLKSWSRMHVCTEPVNDELEWSKLDHPRDVDRLGAHWGYIWYRIEKKMPRAKKCRLLPGDFRDRAIIYLNGSVIGTWGRDQDATRKPIRASFKRGQNSLVILADNLGRFSAGPRLGEQKGLLGHIYSAQQIKTRKFRIKPAEGFARRIVPRSMGYLLGELENRPVWTAEVSIPLKKVSPVYMSFEEVNCPLAVTCNNRTSGFFWPTESTNFGEVTFGSELKKGANRITLYLWPKGDQEPLGLDSCEFYALNDTITQGAKMFYRLWTPPEDQGRIVGKDRPAWYVTGFKYKPQDRALFVHIIGARKGQIFLNGHNLGRFWTVGPQQDYYLPECWLQEGDNELMLFSEEGRIPTGSKLSFKPLGPYRD